MDMLTQTLVEHFLLDKLSLLVVHHPVSKLTVPYKAVPTHRDVMPATPVGDTVSTFPFPHAFRGVQLTGFHGILTGNAIIVGKSHLLFRIREIAGVECHANLEIVFVSVF